MTLADLFAEHGPMMTAKEGSQFLGVSVQRVHELADKGTVRRFYAGRSPYFLSADLEAWAQRRAQGVVSGRGHRAAPVFQLAA